ncbi:MAG: hypothetical protein IJY62_06040 [Clostridia bacterium]|nr:hypothetical protein [Clostridia bacterium]
MKKSKKIMATILSVCLLLSGNTAVGKAFANADAPFTYSTDRFNGSSYLRNETEYVNYAYKVDTGERYVTSNVPEYYDSSDYENTCACVAGAITVGFYDRYYDELIPDFTAGRTIRNVYFYNSQTTAVNNVIAYLYTSMGTNTEGNGTTAAGYRNGLQQYVESRGRSIAYTSMVSNGVVDLTAVNQAVNNNQIGVLFVDGFNLLPLGDLERSSTQDVLYKNYYQGGHVLTVYGYREISYYNANDEMIKHVKLLHVATGFPIDTLVYVMLEDGTIVHEGYKSVIS